MADKNTDHTDMNQIAMAAMVAQAMAYHDDRANPVTYQEALNRATHNVEKLQRKAG